MPSPQFTRLAKGKQEQIVWASLKEFAERGYDLASTNRIVEQAKISKGVLFKYFADKESLFLYVCETVVEQTMESFGESQAQGYHDLFQFLQETTVQKNRFSKEHPLTYQLLARIAKEPEHPVYAKVMDLAMTVSSSYMSRLGEFLPQDKLRAGVTWEQVIFAVTWIAEGLRTKYLATIPDVVGDDFESAYAALVSEMEVYYDMLKHGIYRISSHPQHLSDQERPDPTGTDSEPAVKAFKEEKHSD